MEKVIKTYSINIEPNNFIFDLAKECGEVYSSSLSEFWKMYDENKIWLSKFDLQKHMKDKLTRKLLHSDSFLAAMQQVHCNLASWKQAKKVKPETKPPHKSRFLQSIRFKKSQIRFIKGNIVLSLGVNQEGEKQYYKFKWNKYIPLPQYGNISYNKNVGWKLNLIIEFDSKKQEHDLNQDKILSVDLGTKRIATLFDGNEVLIINGKKLRALNHYQNKIVGKKQVALSQKKKDSKRAKRLNQSWRKKNDKLQAIKKDMLHKTSNLIIKYATNKNIGKIVFGDCSGIHDKTNLGKNNQQVQQGVEMKLAKYVEYKFKQKGGISEYISEAYTSQECPCCKNRKKQTTRTYKCKNCGYVYDRDGVGAINIMEKYISKNVSFDGGNFIERIRCMTQPHCMKMDKTNSYNMLFVNSLKEGKSEKPSFIDASQ